MHDGGSTRVLECSKKNLGEKISKSAVGGLPLIQRKSDMVTGSDGPQAFSVSSYGGYWEKGYSGSPDRCWGGE
ncbi:UNVERIFIED_CONTAM: hypothetical protein Slati_0471600 [Sesamum latifolium]|uniref:Uncharacterized protein n=1 Tax=Sesamum latifolium TaxID=2727402 RepID=A0AAW2XZ66_9LAMI